MFARDNDKSRERERERAYVPRTILMNSLWKRGGGGGGGARRNVTTKPLGSLVKNYFLRVLPCLGTSKDGGRGGGREEGRGGKEKERRRRERKTHVKKERRRKSECKQNRMRCGGGESRGEGGERGRAGRGRGLRRVCLALTFASHILSATSGQWLSYRLSGRKNSIETPSTPWAPWTPLIPPNFRHRSRAFLDSLSRPEI